MGTLPRLSLSPQPSLPMQAQSESKLKLKLELRPWTSSTTLAAGLSEPLTISPTGPKTLTKMLHLGQPLLSTTLEVPLRMLPTDAYDWASDGDNWEALGKTTFGAAVTGFSGDWEGGWDLFTNSDMYYGDTYDKI